MTTGAISDSPQFFSHLPTFDKSKPPKHPDFAHEQALIDHGMSSVCGVDEAGRGPLAGPVVAAAVVLDPTKIPDGLQDSKKLSHTLRAELHDVLLRSADVAIASICADTIDALNIRAASLLAMRRAVEALTQTPDYALIDGNALPSSLPCPATALVKGDGRSVSIAAASIIAKVTRDRMLERADLHFSNYGFADHKGYPTKTHRDLVSKLGPCRLHRQTFKPVADALRTPRKSQ